LGLDVLVGEACGDDIHRDVGGAVGIAEVGVADLRGLEFGAGGVEVVPAFEENPARAAGENRAASGCSSGRFRRVRIRESGSGVV
jgi:hypothetical protein